MIDDPVLNALYGSRPMTVEGLKAALQRRRAQAREVLNQVNTIKRALRAAELRQERDPPIGDKKVRSW